MTAAPRYVVIGHPIAHSLSPRLHVQFGRQAGVALEYAALDVAPQAFAAAVRDFFAAGGCGANVTVPHKGAAFAFAGVHTATAGRLGVANLLTRLADGRIEADSNDGAGMLADLRGRRGIDPLGRSVLLLGAGGAARAAAFALLEAGVGRLVISNRTPARARALTALLLPAPAQVVQVCAWPALAAAGTFDLIINATSAGVQHVGLVLPPSLATARTVAYDLSYGPAAATFLDWARHAGCASAHDGLGMLVETAAASFARWHGVRPDADAALQALRVDPVQAGRQPKP